MKKLDKNIYFKDKNYKNIDFSILRESNLVHKNKNSLHNDKEMELWKEEMKFAGVSILGGFIVSGIANLFGVDIDDEITATIVGANILKREVDKYQLEYGESIESPKIKDDRTIEEIFKEINEILEDEDVESEETIFDIKK